jgi:hypothetical protein
LSIDSEPWEYSVSERPQSVAFVPGFNDERVHGDAPEGDIGMRLKVVVPGWMSSGSGV